MSTRVPGCWARDATSRSAVARSPWPAWWAADRGEDRQPGPLPGIRRQLGGALVGARRRREPAHERGVAGDRRELAGRLGVESGGRRGEVPRLAHRVAVGARGEGVGDRPVAAPARRRRHRLHHRRADQGVPERDAGVGQPHHVGVLGRAQVVDRPAQSGQRRCQELDLGVLEDGGDEERLAGLVGQLAQRPPVGLLEAGADGHRLEWGHHAVDVVGREQRRQVHERQWVAAGRLDERGQPVLGHADAAPFEQSS